MGNSRLNFMAWDTAENIMWNVSEISFLEGTVSVWANIFDEQLGRTERVTNYCMPIADRFILRQWTGLKDRNRVDVYDADICKCHVFTQELGENLGVTEGEEEFICVIVFSPSCGISLVRAGEDSGPIWSYNGFHEESLEVIGNIYENPELLGGK